MMWVSVLVSDCPPNLEKPKLDDNNYGITKEQLKNEFPIINKENKIKDAIKIDYS